MQTIPAGPLHKMCVELNDPVNYFMRIGDEKLLLTDKLGQHIQLKHINLITCTHCGRKTKKSFSQGYCFPCMKKLAQCDACIISPEKCHYFEGTCREPEWGDRYCMQPHFAYLANSSGVKVGITRGTQIPTRWIDQGAIQAMPIAKVSTRQQSGFVEVALKKYVKDKTNWRAMLKGKNEFVDLPAIWAELKAQALPALNDLQGQFEAGDIEFLENQEVTEVKYPVLEFPEKIKAHNFDKTPEVEGKLMGIKGQYLILDSGVLNVRKFTAYHVEVTV
ncbi:MAG: DUF2797 domain-containing protein [Arenicellales bacterium WSBS_2016_MAG_OTU3]